MNWRNGSGHGNGTNGRSLVAVLLNRALNADKHEGLEYVSAFNRILKSDPLNGMLARGEMVRYVFFTFQLVLCHLAGKTGSLNPLNISYLMLSLKITPCIHQVNATHLAAAVHNGGLTWVEHMSLSPMEKVIRRYELSGQTEAEVRI